MLILKERSMKLLTAKELSKMLSLSVRTIWRYRSSDKIPEPVTVGSNCRWRENDIEQWIEMGCPSRKEFEARKEATR